MKKTLINNVSKFLITIDDRLYHLKSNELLLNSKKIKTFESQFGDIYATDYYLIWQDYYGKFEVYDIKGNFVTERNGYFNYATINNSALYYFDTKQNILKVIEVGLDKAFEELTSTGTIEKDKFLVQDKKLSKHIHYQKISSFGNTTSPKPTTGNVGLQI